MVGPHGLMTAIQSKKEEKIIKFEGAKNMVQKYSNEVSGLFLYSKVRFASQFRYM